MYTIAELQEIIAAGNPAADLVAVREAMESGPHIGTSEALRVTHTRAEAIATTFGVTL